MAGNGTQWLRVSHLEIGESPHDFGDGEAAENSASDAEGNVDGAGTQEHMLLAARRQYKEGRLRASESGLGDYQRLDDHRFFGRARTG